MEEINLLKSLKRPPLRGHIESCDRGRVVGWACRIGDPQPVSLNIFIRGAHVGSAVADKFRADLKASGLSDGRCAFSFTVPAFIGDFSAEDVAVREAGSRRAIHFLDRPNFLQALVRRALHYVGGARKHLQHVVHLAKQAAPPRPVGAPVVSLVAPVYNAPPKYLDDLLNSLRRQIHGAWELVLSDDGSTKPETAAWLDRHAHAPHVTILRNATNRGIAAATNAGIAVARAPWIGLIDHDDALAPYALARILRTLESAPDCQFLYTDEIIADAQLKPIEFMLKPAFDPVLLSGVNYINHFSLYRRERLLALGGLREGFQGSQDYDLVLRYVADLRQEQILHLPYPAYVWRRDGGSYSAKFLEKATDSARRALAEAFARDGNPAIVDDATDPSLHRVRFDAGRTDWPLVSVVIPSREALALIAQTLEGLTEGTDYPAMEIVVIDNGSKSPEVLALYQRFREGAIPFRAVVEEEKFNFSGAINKGLGFARGEYVLLLNNDIEVLEPSWLKEMVSCFAYPHVGIVGAKLLYPDRTLQHAGVIVGLGGLAGHWYIERPEDFPGPMGRLWVRQSLSSVTGACLLISRACLAAAGPLDEEKFAIAYNDIDLCLRAGKAGFRVVWTPFATLVHHESASRGSDETPENIERFRMEQANLRDRHETQRFLDPAFNPWYSRDRSEPVPVALPALPEARSAIFGRRTGENGSCS